MKCQVCNTKEAERNSIVCGEICNQIRLKIIKLSNKYTPTNGCNNCLGDLGCGCSEQCKEEFKKSGEFVKELYNLVRLTYIREGKVC
jgi:hypothetical protein